MSHACLYFPAQSITALSAYSFPMPLNWPGWLVAYQDGISVNGHPAQY